MRRLTNLSANSRSLYLPRLSSDQFLDIPSLSQLNGESAFSIIEALLSGKKKMISPLADARIEASNEISQKLKRLKRIDEFIFEERGSHDLHVAWPFIHGKFSDGTFVRSPLLFFPVRIEFNQTHWILVPRKEVEVNLNKSLLLAYSFYNKVVLSEKLMDENFEDFPEDSTSFRTKLYNLFQDAKLEINFNAAQYYQKDLTKFLSFTKEEFDSSYHLGELKLFPEAVLGIFPQAGSSLVPDYQHLLEENSFQDLEEFFLKSENQYRGMSNFIPLVKEDKVYSIFPSDSWQENALKAVKLGNSLVVEGPPGTGKSQLICNLISDAMANGKRVLVVSQKRAALDVVYSRLVNKNLGEFIALVHDFKNDRKEIFEKLSRQIERTDEYKAKNISLDSIQLDRAFFQAARQIDHLTEELEHFRTTLFDESECGTSVKELYLQSDPQQPFVSLKQEYHYFRFHELDPFLRKLKRYSQLASTLERSDHPWEKRRSFAAMSSIDLQRVEKILEDVVGFTTASIRKAKTDFATNSDWEDIEVLMKKQPELISLTKTLETEDLFTFFKTMLQTPEQELSSLWLSNVERMINDCFAQEGPEASIPSSQLGNFQKALHRSMKARKSLWGLIRWELFSKDKLLITRALVANQLKNNKAGFLELEKRLDNRLNLEHNFSKLKNTSWLQNIPDAVDQAKLSLWFLQQQTSMQARFEFASIRVLKNFIDPIKIDFGNFQHAMDHLLRWLKEVEKKIREWENYLTAAQINDLSRDPEVISHLSSSLKKDFDKLCEFDLLKDSLPDEEKSILQKLNEQTKNWKSDELQNLFINSLSLAWIDHIETKHPELRMPSSGKILTIEEDLRHQIKEKENLSANILLLRVRERITDNLEFNRLNNQITYRDLLHQVTKKKKIWPLRKVINDFEEEVFKLTPCWLASPESVSALFPMRELFDLVIFDEASQCFAERGIPALYRGKQAVVAGDSKQLRPGDFYLARWQDDDFEEPDAEVDSLLELVGRYLMKIQLNGHYRSRSWQLIQFSNKNFYEGRLQLLPHFETMNDASPAIEYVKVDGSWENNCNEAEAIAVMEQVCKIWEINPARQIGIVTFNITQQNLILDYADDLFRSPTKFVPENLFVKNIENVQGDERDVIIFSIGYAPDKKGKLNVQFGSLNQSGGENRLNVAVTRAKEKIIIVTSIFPEQLNVTETKNRGPKLLKEYLGFAKAVSEGTELGNFNLLEEPDSSKPMLRNKLANELKNPSIAFSNQYPFADAVVMESGKPKGILLMDDNSYFQSLSCKAEHARIPQLLEDKKWRFLRVYSRNYWIDRKRFLSEIENSI